MPTLKIGASQLYFETRGRGIPLVFAHGVGGNHASWFHQIAELSPRFCTVVFDHRGFGNSTDVEELGRAAFVTDLKALFDTLQIPKAVLIGQSMGAGTCVGFACDHPERVHALVLADSLVGMSVPAELRERMQEVEKRTANLSQLERVLGDTTRRERQAVAELYTQLASFNRTNLRTLRGQMRARTAEELAATGLPALFVVGEEDILFPPELVRIFQARVPRSELAEIARAGHSAFYEAPAAFNAVVVRWLASIGIDSNLSNLGVNH